jgi:hypothetical protein
MNHNDISAIIEDRFKEINKLLRKILKEFNHLDIDEFMLEVRKLKAFLRMAYINEEEEAQKTVIPRLLKIFTGYVGVIQSIQLQIHRIFQYITTYMADQPDQYLKLLNIEKKYWQDEALSLMEDKNFKEVKDQILKRMPRKIHALQITDFSRSRLQSLAGINDLHNEAQIDAAGSILRDFLYLSEYINVESVFPGATLSKDGLQTIVLALEEFKNICAGLELMQPEYLDKISDEKEKNLLSVFQKSLLAKKNDVRKKIAQELNVLSKAIYQREIILSH